MREKILQVKTFGSFSMIYDGKSLFGRKVGELSLIHISEPTRP